MQQYSLLSSLLFFVLFYTRIYSPHFKLSQQAPALLVVRQHPRHRRPESGAVVGVRKMTELMYHNIFLRGGGGSQQPQAERQRAGFQAAGPPAGAHVLYGDSGQHAAGAIRRK